MGNSRPNSKSRADEAPLGPSSGQAQERIQVSHKKKTSDNRTNEISSDDDAEANVDNEMANDVSAERPGNGPAQKIKILHNVPKASGQNLMIKSKATMNFSQAKGFMSKNNVTGGYKRNNSSQRLAGQGSYKAINLSNYQSIQNSSVKPKLHINSGETSAQSTGKKI